MSDLSKVELIFKDWLDEAKKDLKKRGPYWNPSLVTHLCQARTVVLRSIENDPLSESPRFVIHTDIRSQKWSELKENSEASLHFYCQKRKWQMRINGEVSLHQGDDESKIEWRRLSENSKQIYKLNHTPGIEVESPKNAYSFNEEVDPFDNFGVIILRPTKLESLQLNHPMRESFHVRAQWLITPDTNQSKYGYLAP